MTTTPAPAHAADTPATRLPGGDPLVDALPPPVGRTSHLLIPAAIAFTALYLLWIVRGAQVGNPFLFALFFGAQMFSILSAAGFWWTVTAGTRRRDRNTLAAHLDAGPVVQVVPRQVQAPPPPKPSVDVLVPTYNEAVDLIEATVAAATRVKGAAVTVWVLDDGDRPEVADLARRSGVRYLARSENVGAKAGNLNHALEHCRSDFVAVLDCDHVPHPDFLTRTLSPLLEDHDMAFVQSPQYYRNHDESQVADASWSQQQIFFGPIAAGKDTLGAMICCGTNVVFRRQALDAVGGFPTSTVTEDFSLGISMHSTGWRSAYVPEVLAEGLAPTDMASYVSQQNRWARGCISSIPQIVRASMPAKLKAQYLLSASHFLNGWTLLVYMSLPVIFLFTGAQPLAQSTASAVVTYFLPYFFFSMLIVNLASGWTYSFNAFALASSTFWVHIWATLQSLTGRSGRFVVTSKDGRPHDRQLRPVMPALVTIGVLVLACLYGAAQSPDAAAVNNIALVLLHVVVLLVGTWPALQRGSETPTVSASPEVEVPAEEAPAAERPRRSTHAHVTPQRGKAEAPTVTPRS